jgi:hypothetical protein
MSRVTESPSSQFAQSIRFLILPATILVALACACGETRGVLNILATETVSPATGIPGGGIATETITPLQPDMPTPTPTVPEPTVTPTIPPTSTPTEPPPPSGSGDWGATESDFEMLEVELHPQWDYLILHVRNNGPDFFSDTVEIACAGQGVSREGRGPELPMYHDVNFSESVTIQMLPAHQTFSLGTNWHLVPDIYDYGIVCSIDAGVHDSNVSNNAIWVALP